MTGSASSLSVTSISLELRTLLLRGPSLSTWLLLAIVSHESRFARFGKSDIVLRGTRDFEEPHVPST